MKRYILFGGDFYYPEGGWEDFIGSFDSAEELKAEVKRRRVLEKYKDDDYEDWFNAVDINTGKEVELS